MEQTTTIAASVDRNEPPIHASDWPIHHSECIKLAWETEARAEPMMLFAANQLAGPDAFRTVNADLAPEMSRVFMEMLERSVRLMARAPDSIADINLRLVALVDVATLNHDAQRFARLSTADFRHKAGAAGRAADGIWGEACRMRRNGEDVPVFVPGDIVRKHLPWTSLPQHAVWERPAPFGRCADGRPVLACTTDPTAYLRAAEHLGIDPERLIAGLSAAVEAVVPHAHEGPHAARAIERAREWARNAPSYPDPERAVYEIGCALADPARACACCRGDETGTERERAWAITDPMTSAALREAWPDAAALVDEYAAPKG